MKQRQQAWVSRNSSGFTLIEVMVGILIMAATAATMFYGVSYARSQARRIIIQQRALEELRSQMDYWMVRILDGNLTNHDLLGDTKGTEITLYNPDADERNDDEAFKAMMYRLPMDRRFSDHDPEEDSPYYFLEMYIQWSDHLGDATGEPAELRMQYSVFKNL